MVVLSLSLSRGTEALPKPTKGERKRMSVAEFVEARFADFDRAYGLPAIDTSIAKNEKSSKAVNDAKNKTANNNGNSSSSENNSGSNKSSSLTKKQIIALKTRNEESESDEDDDACVTLTYFALLTSLYLPLLLFLWIRRSVFGAGSLIRSLFLGHILRLILAFLLLPPSTTKSLVPTWAWNLGVSTATKAERLWNDKRVQGMIPGWLHICLAIILGTNEGANHVSSGGSNTYDFPPALTALTIFTISVFVVHPDGLTWIMLERMRDGIRSTLQKTVHVIIMMKDGSINLTPSEISGTIAGFFIVYTIIRSIVSPKKRKEDATPTPHKEKTTRYKHKKGRKGRGRNHHGNSGGGRGRIRGGHYRSAKDLIESSNRTTSRSPSHSPSNRQRCDSDMEATTVSAISEVNVTTFDGCKKDSHQKSKAETTGSSLPLESRVEDENSCASSLATHHSNSASTQEGGKRSHRNGRGKKGRKNTSNDISFLHQTECKEKKSVGCDEGSNQMRRDNTHEPFVSEEVVSGNAPQTHQSSQPESRSKKKSRSQRSKNKRSNKLPKSDAEFQGQSSTSFFSSTVSPGSIFHQNSDNMEGQKTVHTTQLPLLKGNQQILSGVSQRNVAVSPPRQSVQWQGTDSTSPFELTCSDEGQSSINRYSAISNQYEASNHQYEETSNQYQATSNQYEATHNQYKATHNQYKATHNQHEATGNQYAATGNQYAATGNQYAATGNQYDATYHPYTSSNNQQEAISNQYDATYQPYTPENNQQEVLRNDHKTTHLLYKETPTIYKAASNQYETTPKAQTNPILHYNVPNYEHAHSYFNAQDQFSAGKQELTAFFVEEVQLNGAACKEILDNVEDIDSLEKLTDKEYHACGVEPTKRVEIKALLEARRRRQMFDSISRQQNLMPWSTGISPPPGLVPNLDSAVTASEALSNRTLWKECDQQQSMRSSYSPLPSSPGSGRALSSSRILDLPQCSTDNRVVNTTTTPHVPPYEYNKIPVMPSISNSAAMPTFDHGQNFFGSALNNDAKIEADLHELGGQMAGSILDF